MTRAKRTSKRIDVNMNLSVANEDILYHLLSKCSIVSIMKLYALNRHFITDEMLKLFINNRWAIHIGKCIVNSILRHDYLDFGKKPTMIRKATAIHIADSSIWATNRIINMKYNNIEDKDAVLNDLLLCYDNIYRTNNPQKNHKTLRYSRDYLGMHSTWIFWHTLISITFMKYLQHQLSEKCRYLRKSIRIIL